MIIMSGATLVAWTKGKSQYTRYATQFTKPVTQLDTQLKILGFETGDLGYHSCRKGVATMLDAGCAVYPHIVALCILEGWVLGVVKYTYLFRKKSGDNYVGRYASCLDQLKRGFAVSPPYFYFIELCEIEKLDHNMKICQFLETLLPIYASIST